MPLEQYIGKSREKERQNRSYFDESEDEYHEIADETDEKHACTIPASGNEEIDPLDAFMQGIDAQVSEEAKAPRATTKPEIYQDNESDHAATETVHHRRSAIDSEENSDEEVYATAKRIDSANPTYRDDLDSKSIVPSLTPIDHSEIAYKPFRKCLYTPIPGIASLPTSEILAIQKSLDIVVEGNNVPCPVQSFAHLQLRPTISQVLVKLNLETPTPIQAQAFPIALSGRDMLAIAKTGSGKTLAYTLPLILHVLDQDTLKKDDGPIAIVISPTRELAHQIYTKIRLFAAPHGAQCAAIYGGVNAWEQVRTLRKGAEIVVATPGRLIDLVRKRSLRTNRTTLIVLDEADRMLDMGFEPQLHSILSQLRPDRQTLLFSATFRPNIEYIARTMLQDPLCVRVGRAGANEIIVQVPVVLPDHIAKYAWFRRHIDGFCQRGRVLVFVSSKNGCELLSTNLNKMGLKNGSLHGDKTQYERSMTLNAFRSDKCRVLIATDVAARGLDIHDIKTVVNYDVAKNAETHVHRIGRTGRMGIDGFEEGEAYTLITRQETRFAKDLVRMLENAGQSVSKELLEVAQRSRGYEREDVREMERYAGARKRKHGGIGFESQSVKNSSKQTRFVRALES